jgi:hypothetical protein
MPRHNTHLALFVLILVAALGTASAGELPLFTAAPIMAADSPHLIARLMIGDTLDGFGRCIAPAGDVNLDNFDDFWVSRSKDAIWSDFYLYFGGNPPDTVPAFSMRQPALRLYNVGDLNLDGFDDFLLIYTDTITLAPDYFGLHWGGPLLSVIPAMRFPIHAYDGFGEMIGSPHMVIGGIDMDDDGGPDLLVGEPTGNGGNGAFLYSSYPTFDTIADYHFAYGEFPDIQQSGWAVGYLPNLDGSSYVLLGVPGYGGDPTTPGSVCFFRAGAGIDTIPEFVLHDPLDPSSFAFGYQIVALDANGDGLTDFVIHANNTPGDLFLGHEPTDTALDITILPNFGSVRAAGDLNYDGYQDLLISEEAFQGRVWIYYGGPTMDGIVDMKVFPPVDVVNFGREISGVGDVNGDGVEDFAAGAMLSTFGWWPGVCLVYSGYGKPPVDVEQDAPLPYSYNLLTNYPNPFNPGTTIEYTVLRRSDIELSIFNSIGQKVVTLVTGQVASGKYSVEWDGASSSGEAAPSGLYLCRLKVNNQQLTRKLMLVR